MNYQLLDYCGIISWTARTDHLPFFFDEIYYKADWIAVLPIHKSYLVNNLDYKNIKDLYIKMLAVLELPRENLLKTIISYDKTNFTSIEKTSLTLKLLRYAPKIILTFGTLNFLSHDLLKRQHILFRNTLHPQHLLANPQEKKIAYQDLLACKKINFYANLA